MRTAISRLVIAIAIANVIVIIIIINYYYYLHLSEIEVYSDTVYWCHGACVNAGYAEMIRQMFPPVPTLDFSPNFTGYNLNNRDWYKTYKSMAQSPDDAIRRVSTKYFGYIIQSYWTYAKYLIEY